MDDCPLGATQSPGTPGAVKYLKDQMSPRHFSFSPERFQQADATVFIFVRLVL